ncbi:hypothetical protein MBANPS3_007598 [Mucor bainieri]
MLNYPYLLEKYKEIEASGPIIPIAGAVLASVAAMYGMKAVFRNKLGGASDGAKKYRVIPTPSGSVFYFGHKLLLGDISAHKIAEWHKELGPILRVKMGNEDWIYVADAGMAHELFTSEDSLASSSSPHFMFGNGTHSGEKGHIAFDNDDAKWRDVRSAMLHFLSPTSLTQPDILQGLQEEAQKTVDKLIDKTQQHGSVNPLSLIRGNSISIILATSFGQQGERSLQDPLYRCLVYKYGAYLQYPSLWKPWYWMAHLRRFFGRDTSPMNTLYRPLQRVIQRARKSDQDNVVKRIDLLKEEYTIDEHDVTMISGKLYHEACELLVAGTDALSSATAWTLAILCHHPDVQQHLAREIDVFFRKNYRFPTIGDLPRLPYYNALLKECLRFRPPVYFGIPRKANEDVVCRNYLIPKGSTVVGNIHAISNDNYLIQNPEKFLPERFQYDSRTLHDGANDEGSEEHYAFGWGKRLCLGVALAKIQMFNIVTRVMSRCTIEPAIASNGRSVYPNLSDVRNAGATVVPGPFKLRFIERDDRKIV